MKFRLLVIGFVLILGSLSLAQSDVQYDVQYPASYNPSSIPFGLPSAIGDRSSQIPIVEGQFDFQPIDSTFSHTCAGLKGAPNSSLFNVSIMVFYAPSDDCTLVGISQVTFNCIDLTVHQAGPTNLEAAHSPDGTPSGASLCPQSELTSADLSAAQAASSGLLQLVQGSGDISELIGALRHDIGSKVFETKEYQYNLQDSSLSAQIRTATGANKELTDAISDKSTPKVSEQPRSQAAAVDSEGGELGPLQGENFVIDVPLEKSSSKYVGHMVVKNVVINRFGGAQKSPQPTDEELAKINWAGAGNLVSEDNINGTIVYPSGVTSNFVLIAVGEWGQRILERVQ